jgi:putative FmdB family regulatory protein
MPIYEYKCKACGERFEMLVRSVSRQSHPACPKCGSQKVKKAISLFGVAATTGSTAVSASCSPGST